MKASLTGNDVAAIVRTVAYLGLEARPVVLDGYAAGQARIASGLADGERVVVLGAHRLQAGSPVRALAAEG